MVFNKAELDYLGSQLLGRLATVAPDGTVQNSPVGFFVQDDPGVIDIGGQAIATTKKFANVQANPKVALVVDDLASMDPWRVRGIEIRGTAETIADADPPRPGFGAGVIRIRPDRIISWGIDPEHPQHTARNV